MNVHKRKRCERNLGLTIKSDAVMISYSGKYLDNREAFTINSQIITKVKLVAGSTGIIYADNSRHFRKPVGSPNAQLKGRNR